MKKKTIQIRIDQEAHDIITERVKKLEAATGGSFTQSAAIKDLHREATKK